jgi:hypothetical protein
VPSGPSLCSIKQAREDDLGSSLQSGGKTLWHRKDSGSVAETFLLVETSTRCRKVYQVMHRLRYCQTDHKETGLIHPSVDSSMDYMSNLSSTKRGNDYFCDC